MKKFAKNLFLSANILALCAIVPLCVSANKDEVLSEINNNEEKVIISIINFGRSNPFQPYKPPKKKKKVVEDKKEDSDEIPYPPPLAEEVGEELDVLMNSKVNGILYDPYSKSVAIVNINGADYMMHKGDKVQGITIDDITKDKITLKYESNTYTVGVGEVVDGNIQYDSVERAGRSFGQAEYRLPDLNVEELIKND